MRLLRPSLAVFCVAILASLCIHLPVYEVLGALANVVLNSMPSSKPAIVELELAPLADEPVPPKLEQKAAQAHVTAPTERPQPKELPPKPIPQQEPKPVKPLVAEAPAPAQPTPPLPSERQLAVTQKSEDPNQAKPDNAHFVADENRRVEEETVARIRNLQRDDQNPTPTATPTKNETESGDAEKTDIKDLRNEQGSTERTPNLREAEAKHDKPSEPSAGSREALAMQRPSAEAPTPASREVAGTRASGAPDTGGEPQTIVVQDGSGSFRIRKAPLGQGPGNAGSAQRPGQPSQFRNEREGSRALAGSNANLRMSFSQFEDTFGADELRKQREAYLAQRRSSAQGQSRQRSWREFRAAIENFVPNVRPGDQTALNAAADPFANYLAVIHRRIHREYVFGFIDTLPVVGGPYDDYSLHTELEIVINGDGTLYQVGVAETSGSVPFDYNAFSAVKRAGPYPEPPRKILSGDGRVYMHWGFYRNERACGTFNARPYILPHPPGTPKPGNSPFHDPGEQRPAAPASSPPPRPGEGELGLNEPPGAPDLAHGGR